MNADAGFLAILLGHNRWATGVLLDSCATLTTEQLHQRFDIGPGTIHDTLRHVIGAMLRWSDRIAVRAVRPSIETPDGVHSIAALQALLVQADRDLTEVAQATDASGLWTAEIEFVSEGITYRFTRASAMMHVLTHGVHHRAQVLHMRKRLGLPPLGLDLDPVEWECVQRGQIGG